MTLPRARRLAVALGLAGAACLMLVLAPLLPGQRAPTAAESQRHGFVGSATCAQCHAAQAALWHGSDHQRAMQPATPATVLGDFSGASVTDQRHSATFLRDGENFVVRTDGPGGTVGDFTVTDTFGVDPLQQYLVLFPDGRRQALPWAWDTRPREAGGQRWYHLMAGEALAAGDPLHWTGRDFTWNFMCAACHSTGVVRGYDPQADRYNTRWSEISVGCESCHGRGEAHVAWARGGAPAGVPDRGLEVALRDRSGGHWAFGDGDARGIARWQGPPREATGTELDACAPCHARARPIVADPLPGARFLDTHAPALLAPGLYHANGQIEGEVFEWGSFVQSRMQRAGVVCSDCHDPHSGKLRAEGNLVCAQCHLPARFDTPSHHRHTQASAGAQCIACHMPAVTYMGVDRRHDHAFSLPRPDIAAAIGAPDACTSCHTRETQAWAALRIAQWFGPRRAGDPHPALAIAAGRRGERTAAPRLAAIALDQAQPGIMRTTALSLLTPPPGREAAQAVGASLRDADPLVRAAALRALEGFDPRNRQHAVALLEDPVRLVRIAAARLLAPVPIAAIPPPARDAFEAAWRELIDSELVAAERPEAHLNIAGLLAARGDATGAEAAFAEALRRDPAFLPALTNYAQFEAGRGRNDAAEALLSRAVAAHPGSPEAHFALALALVRAGKRQAALPALARAASLGADTPRYAYTQAIALYEAGQREEAIRLLRATLQRHPGHRDSLLALATIERDRMNLIEAERLAGAAAALDPADHEAAALLAQLRAARQRMPAQR